MPVDPRTLLHAWLPHLALLGLVLLAGWWLLVVIAPVRDALMLAVAVAVITYPVVFLPLDHLVAVVSGGWRAETRRYVSALAATVLLTALVVGAALLVLVAVVGDLGGTVRLVVGLAVQDPSRITEVVDLLMARASALAALFPDLHLDLAATRAAINGLLTEVSVGPAFVQFLITGTGGFLAQSALTLVTLFYLFAQGPRLVAALMSCLPLSEIQRQTINQRFHATAMHLVTGTLARALTHGVVLGLLAWTLGGFNPVLVACGTAVIALLPVAGPTVAWVPLASVLWAHDAPAAIGLGVAALSAAWLVEHLAGRLASHLGTDDLWLGFLLFLGLVGGVLGFGVRGLILGPAAVLTVSSLVQVLPALYGRSDEPTSPST